MPIQSCLTVAWSDIWLNKSRHSRDEDIPVEIKITSTNNPTIINSTVKFYLTAYGSTVEKPLTVVSSSAEELKYTTTISIENDLFQIPVNEDAEVCFVLNAQFQGTLDMRRVAQGSFFVLKEDGKTSI